VRAHGAMPSVPPPALIRRNSLRYPGAFLLRGVSPRSRPRSSSRERKPPFDPFSGTPRLSPCRKARLNLQR
jgi:hypothetical protein